MKKKLSCLLLTFALILSSVSLFSCSEEEGTKSESSSRNPMTLTLYVPTYEGTTQSAIAQVETALNKITKQKYNTAIELHAISSDKYEQTVENRINEINEIQTQTEAEKKAAKQAKREAIQRGETVTETELVTEVVETAEEDTVVYPSVTSTQMDLFLIRGYEDFMKYAENSQLSAIDDELNGSAKLIKSYVYPTYLEQATLYDATYAVPNSHPAGEYTYVLINKELCDKYYYDPETMTTLSACRDFILDVGKNSSVTPFLSEVEATGLTYWSPDGSRSILATIILDDSDPTSKLNIRNIFGLKSYCNTVTLMKELKENGYLGSNPDALEFGVGVIKGTAADLEKYGDNYYVNVLAKPRMGQDDIYSAMFAVSAYTKDIKRSMEIMTLINTNSEFRTILQYGVQGVNWEIDEDAEGDEEVIKILNKEYNMKLEETGNVFITYPGEGIPMSYWDAGNQQNLDSILDPLCRFTNPVDDSNKDYFAKLAEESAAIFKEVDAMTSAEFTANIEALKEKVTATDGYFYLTDEKADKYESLAQKYTAYYAQFFG